MRNTDCSNVNSLILCRYLFNSHLEKVVLSLLVYFVFDVCVQNWAVPCSQLVCLSAKREGWGQGKCLLFAFLLWLICDSACQLPHPIGHHAWTAGCCSSRCGSSRGQPAISDQNETPPCQSVPGKNTYQVDNMYNGVSLYFFFSWAST